MPVRVDIGIAQLGGYPVLQSLGNKVLQPFGFFVHLIPRIIQEVVEESFEQPMMPHNFERPMLPSRRKKHAVMLLIQDPGRFVDRQLLKHARYRGGTDSESFRKRVAGDPFFFRTAQLKDCFEVIVNRFRA